MIRRAKLVVLGLIFTIFIGLTSSDLTSLRIRKGSKIFMRLTLKLNTVPYTTIFANAIGYRVNWDIMPPARKKVKPKKPFRPNRKNFLIDWVEERPLRKREVHETLANILNRHGFNGDTCVERAFCESSLIQPYDVKTKLFSIIFPSLPESRRGMCDRTFEDCPLSLLHVLMHN